MLQATRRKPAVRARRALNEVYRHKGHSSSPMTALYGKADIYNPNLTGAHLQATL